jgi:glycosyltransferase involved in cell wall biosynthesis
MSEAFLTDRTWPLISVVIPVYNAAVSLPAAVASIRQQGYPSIEIVIVDDGSAESAEPVALGLGPGIVFHRQPNAGPAAARNRGLSLARGEWITFLDADDLWPANKLAIQAPWLIEDPALDVVLGRIQYVSLEGADEIKIQLSPEDQSISHVHLGSMLARRRAFDTIGGFDEGMRYSEDQDWFLRAREANLRMIILDAVTLHYQLHADNMTRQKSMHELRILEALHKSMKRRRAAGIKELRPWSSYFQQAAGGNPLVTAIIPAYNGERFLAQAIRSILQQDYSPIEVIVVDDGSTDQTAQVAQSFSRVRYIRQENQGPGAARNRGIAEAKGDFIAFLDQDDYWMPGKIRAQMKYLAEHPELEYVVTGHARYLEVDQAPPPWFRPEWLNQDLGGFEPGALLARRKVFDSVGLFRADLLTNSDMEWFFRAKDLKVAYGRIDTVLLMRRYHGENQSSQLAEQRRGLLEVARASIQRQVAQRQASADEARERANTGLNTPDAKAEE